MVSVTWQFLISAWEALIRYERGDRQAIALLPYAGEIVVGELPLRSASVFRKVRDALPAEAGPLLPFGTLMVANQGRWRHDLRAAHDRTSGRTIGTGLAAAAVD